MAIAHTRYAPRRGATQKRVAKWALLIVTGGVTGGVTGRTAGAVAGGTIGHRAPAHLPPAEHRSGELITSRPSVSV